MVQMSIDPLMIRLSALTLRARLVKTNHQIDAGFIGFVNEPTVIGRPELQTIPGLHFVAGVAFLKDQLPDCSQISWRASA